MRFAPRTGAGYIRAAYLRPNPSLLSRLVGYVEYGRAIDHLEKLVDISSADELQVADSIVKEWDRYDVRMSLSGSDSNPSTSSTVPSAPETKLTKKQGLAWVMAFARVETAAMVAVAMLDSSPFVRSRPTQFERQAFIELLGHDTSIAIDSLREDPFLSQLQKNGAQLPNEHHIQTYSQRLTMIESFVQGCLHFSSGDSSEEQIDDLHKTYKQIRRMRLAFIDAVR